MSKHAENPASGLDDSAGTFRQLAVLLRPHRGALTVVLVMLIALAVLNMILPAYFIKLLLDDVFPDKDWTLLWWLLAGILAVYVGRNSLYFVSKYTAVVIGEQVCFRLRKRLFEALQQMNLQFYRQNKPGKLSSRVMDDSYVLQQFIQDDLPTLLQATFLFIGLVAWIYAINWQLALASTIVLPLHLLAFTWFRRPIKKASGRAAEELAIVRGNLIEKMLGIEVVKSFTGEQFENEEFERAIDRSRKSELKSKRYHVTQKIVADLLVGLGTIALLGFGAYQVMKPDGMKIGMFSAFLTLVLKLYPTVLELMSGFAKLTRCSASTDRIFDMLEAQVAQAAETAPAIDPAARERVKRMRGAVRFENISFSYGDGETILHNVSFQVPAGHVCAIVGPSGAGKSTLASLVPRFNDVDSGTVYIDDHDVRDYPLSDLRQAIGIAFQETFLFNSSILENIRYARPDVSLDQIITVARRTGAHEFIERMSDGYHTVLGENGVSLSRGEKQRITLTRAMLKDPKILILDEATASIDAVSATRIIPNILDFMEGKTTLLITHRPELLSHADTVVQIVDGRVAYQGEPAGLPDLIPTVGEHTDQTPPPRHGAASGVWPSVNVWLAAALIGLTALTGLAHAQDKPAKAPTAKPAPKSNTPADGIFRPLHGMSDIEVSDLIDVVISQAQARMKYRLAGEAVAANLPAPPPGLRQMTTLARSDADGLHLIQIGFRTFRSQPPHLWVYGRTLPGEGEAKANADVAKISQMFDDAVKARARHSQQLDLADLATENVTLSYIEADRALAILKTLGYQTIEYKSGGKAPGKTEVINPASKVDVKKLPAIAALPSTNSADLVGGNNVRGGSFGLTMTPSVASNLPAATASAPMMELMIMYDPAKPGQYASVLDRLRRSIDVPARQILIEAMVLEIAETGLDSLGVQWTLQTPQQNLSSLKLGRLPSLTDEGGAALDAELNDIFGIFTVKLQALIREGKAEVLSRPSVLTLDNRQASIRVGEDIPVATSASGLRGGDRISFDFKYIPVGILLNVRPRVADDGEEVSMQVDGIVSATVPNEDLIVTDNDGNELARAPRISTRRVQTYSRIANNTPFIIGGLISKNSVSVENKVPLLGDIPYVGEAFKSSEVATLKREVIIVITPYVVPENNLAFRGLPKDEDAFDSFGHKLFHDVYRIRAEDLFDLTFLTENDALKQFQDLVNAVVRRNFEYAGQYPFNQFVGDRIPGEEILVYRQMYEVIKRLDLEEKINPSKLIYFHPDETAGSGFDVEFLEKFLQKQFGGEVNEKGLFNKRTENTIYEALQASGKALMLTYTRRENNVREVLSQPVPEVRIVPCPNREVWAKLLWEFNQPDAQGRERSTLLVQSPKDIIRLRRAIALKHTVRLNSARLALRLNNFSIGRLLLMPHLQQDKVHLVDGEVARYFFLTEQYYQALEKRLIEDLGALREKLKSPAVHRLLPPDAVIPEPRADVSPPSTQRPTDNNRIEAVPVD